MRSGGAGFVDADVVDAVAVVESEDVVMNEIGG